MVALADREEVVDMVEMVVLKAAAMELAWEVCMVDQEVDMAAEAADSAVDDSVDATQDWALLEDRRLVHLAEWKEVYLAVALEEDLVEASVEEVDRALEVLGYLAAPVAAVEVEAVLWDLVVLVTADLEAALAEASEEAKA